MLDFLKSICNLYDLYFIWFILSFIWLFFFFRKKRIRLGSLRFKEFYAHFPLFFKLNLLSAFIFYLVCATQYVPQYLIYQKEAKFEVFNSSTIDTSQTYYIHVLGAGYSLDERFYPTQKLSSSSLVRLVEAIRITRALPHFKLVTSAYSKYGLESQASITKKAAMELGVDAERIFMLETPSTTSEEADAFIARFGTEVHLIVSSDALHLPRAIQIYHDKGIEAIPAPTNFKVKVDENNPIVFSFPKHSSFKLANTYFVSVLKECYYKATGK